MDLGLYARVLWRFRAIVVFGAVVAATLAALSMVRVDGDGVSYRDEQLWASTTRLGVTQNGFPWGRLLAEFATENPSGNPDIPLANPARLNELAVLYAELATSDPVRRLMLRDGPIPGDILTTPVVGGDNRVMLPLIDLTAIATSPREAVELADRSAQAVGTYIRDQQLANDVPRRDRVVIEQLEQPKRPQIWQARSKTLPIVVFLAVMFATIGLAFVLENLRPRPPRELAEPESGRDAQHEIRDATRRTA